ncbi:putative nicotinate-nucleotide pyrophosphorylase [carboxylating] [Commensalibacter sp. Nvir]|uniref:carboxylating nicotinate-nucleotide diphosphorylase n=1 Tax=Commensalibacter sp. Nvir TaxID=3069817 RepID=UPI002D47E1B2|nr:putative nicotinate-nucleotide pyrophosphorylase [carboxylating] [Commensalibacter sp. Nvir]
MSLPLLQNFLVEPLIKNALNEDLGLAGDITSQLVIPENHHSKVFMVSRQHGILSGVQIAQLTFQCVSKGCIFHSLKKDGEALKPNEIIATIEGPTRSLLTAERTALNFMCHLSGIASITNKIVQSIAHTKTKVVCTRKTTPGLRLLEKYAVRCGGGMNHRFALYDGILIKDNHIAVTGSVTKALKKVKKHSGHMVKIEIEVDTLEQLKEALSVGVDVILLDNMSPEQLKEAVQMVNGKAITEASGRINIQSAAIIAESGVDFISVGWITHSAPIIDIGLDYL